jgi:cysteinyl-tRNA synthetase
MLTLNGKKMAKSTGNNLLPGEIFSGENSHLTKPYSPTVVRFFMMQAHYTSVLDLSDEALGAAEKGYNRLMDALALLPKIEAQTSSQGFDVALWRQKCYQAMNDDFNTPVLIAHLFEAVKQIQLLVQNQIQLTESDLLLLSTTLNDFVFDVLGLETKPAAESDSKRVHGLVQLLIQLRNDARQNRDFALSDQIRDALSNQGVVLKDTKEGTQFTLE